MSSGLEPTPAVRACLGDPSGYDGREEMEPHVAIDPGDPDHLVAAWMARVNGQAGAILAAGSRDGGVTWSRPAALPFSACAGGDSTLSATSDPWVAIGADGRVYVSAMGWTPGEPVDSASVLTVVTSRGGDADWSGPIAVSTAVYPDFMHDNTALTVDPSVPGLIWLATTRINDEGWPATVTRSHDGGETWTPLSFVIPSNRAGGAPQSVVAGGSVYVFFGHGRTGSRVSFVRSEDEGETWSDPALVHEGAPVDGPLTFPGTDAEIMVAPDIMHPAADPTTGDLYVTFTTADPEAVSRPVVWLTASRDGGLTWTTPSLVGEPGEAAWRPTLAVAPGGPALVTFFRSGPTDPGPEAAFDTQVRMRSFEWSGGELVSGSASTLDRFDWLPRYTGSYFLGDYHGLVASSGAAVAVFARSVENGSRIVAVREVLP